MTMKKFLLAACCFCFAVVSAQSVTNKLKAAFQQFENDPQLRSAIASLYVVDAKTGQVVFDKNSAVGLAPASTQKLFSAATAYEILGKGFRYETKFGYDGKIINDTLNGNIYVMGSGDPTLGSWRWKETKEDVVLNRIVNSFKKLGVKATGMVVTDNSRWNFETIPDGWIWQDI